MSFINVIDKNKCTGCMACKNICPKKAIIEEKSNGFFYPKIKQEDCINCNLCSKICPVINNDAKSGSKIEAYCCINENENIRMKSSSGGVFTLIAQYVLQQKGVIFGSRFNSSLEVIHDYIEKEEDLDLFRGSKYVQSEIGNSYIQVKQFLQQGRKVLFTGTPCQVEGLLAYLQKDYPNLYTQDFICHGVPSPEVWKKYIEYKEKQSGEKLKKVNFRTKNLKGWTQFQVKYTYSTKEEYVNHNDDPYMKLFLENFILRESCYNCKFKKVERNSDITIADFWGINKINPEWNDEKGVSAVIVNSNKGREIFENIKKNMKVLSVNIEDIAIHNSAIYQSVKYNNKREEFFKDLDKENFENIIEKYL